MASVEDYPYTFIGARYVPKFSDSAWNSSNVYEPLIMVVVNDNIYISKQYVPSGIQITNTEYWEMMPAFDTNSQTAITNAVNAWLDAHPEATTTVQDGSITNAKLVQSGGILSEITNGRIEFDNVVNNTIGNAIRNKTRINNTKIEYINKNIFDETLESVTYQNLSSLLGYLVAPENTTPYFNVTGTGNQYLRYFSVIKDEEYIITFPENYVSGTGGNRYPSVGFFIEIPEANSTFEIIFNCIPEVHDEFSISYIPPKNGYIACLRGISVGGSRYYPSIKHVVKTSKFLNIAKSRFDDKFNYIAYSKLLNNVGGHINTKEHYLYCANQNIFTSIKGDVRPTLDNKLVMCHDSGFTFNSDGYITTFDSNNNTPIRTLTLDECLNYQWVNSSGEHITDFETYISICKYSGKIAFITVRDEYINDILDYLFNLIHKYRMETNCIFNSFTQDTLNKIRAYDNDVMLSWVMDSSDRAITIEKINYCISLGNCLLCGFDFPNESYGFNALESYSQAIDYAIQNNIRIYEAIVNDQNITPYDLMKYGVTGCQYSVMV